MKKLFEILKQEKMIWVEVERKNAKEFLKILKSLNFMWINGKNININEDEPFFHLSLESNGTLANVAMFAWFSPDSKHIKKLTFEDFKKLI